MEKVIICTCTALILCMHLVPIQDTRREGTRNVTTLGRMYGDLELHVGMENT